MPAAAPIGLDIGSVSIRAVEVTRTKDRPVITNFGQAVLPTGAMVGGVVRDERAVTAALRELWADQKFRSKDVLIGVTHQQVVVREVELPYLPPREAAQALPYQVRDILPLPIEQAVLDFQPLERMTGAAADKGGKHDTVRGLLVAAPKEAVLSTVRAVERAGLRVLQVDLSCFAALRAAAYPTPESEAVIDIGANGTNIIIHTDGVPHIVRSIPRGGLEITRLLAERLRMSTEDAEKLKCRVGLVATVDPQQPDVREAVAVVQEAVRPFLNEVRSSISYFAGQQTDRTVTRLALVGGASQLSGLTEQLTAATKIPAYLADPLQHVEDSRRGGRHDVLGRFRSSATVAIGLTLRAA